MKPKKGRPAVDSEAVNVRLLRSLLNEVDDFRRTEPDIPSRPEAIRRLVEAGVEFNLYQNLLIKLIEVVAECKAPDLMSPGDADWIYKELLRISKKENMLSDQALATSKLQTAVARIRERCRVDF